MYLLFLAATVFEMLVFGICLIYLDTRVSQPEAVISEGIADSARWLGFYARVTLIGGGLITLAVATLSLIIAFVSRLPYLKRRTNRTNPPLSFRCAAFAFTLTAELFVLLCVMDVVEQRMYFKAFAATARSAEGLIGAIESYKQANGEYPYRLDSVVPEFAAEVPHTGLAGFTRFRYVSARRWPSPAPFKNYILIVGTGLESVKKSFFFYWPEGNYPERFEGLAVTPLGGWAYVG